MELFRMLVSVGLISLLATTSSAIYANTTTIFFRHYSNDSYTDINIEDVDTLVTYFKLADCSTVYVHGYTESVESDSVKTVVGAYLNYTTTNIFAVDYRNYSGVNYFFSLKEVDTVSEAIANAFNKLYDAGVTELKCMHLVGHSLGGQVSARVGMNVNFSIRRITGLDPAGPLIFSKYLNSTDGRFVDIIHTDAGAYGQIFDSGTVNFRPNYGIRLQPGCPISFPLSDEDYCSHHRSWHFWAESIKNKTGFLGVKCSSSFLFALGLCNYTDIIPMGLATPSTATGYYYLHTNAESPYAKGMEGTKSSLKKIFG